MKDNFLTWLKGFRSGLTNEREIEILNLIRCQYEVECENKQKAIDEEKIRREEMYKKMMDSDKDIIPTPVNPPTGYPPVPPFVYPDMPTPPYTCMYGVPSAPYMTMKDIVTTTATSDINITNKENENN